ncbi:contact-dependent growth inhibition system immunity protein [Nocardioides plantarum]|uniref:Contact-dependent growth inhibition system immunity protein n=1 Tax=Nocardioides plantarum TaxID=29299 RepID=A0ABV5K9E6_9ACTN|nr:contact-dependent growth inhibition system immunity protein [Nocardioides plantarum]
METYEQLGVLMGAYFHEDFEGLEAPLEEYLADASDDEISVLVSDVDAFVAATPITDLQPALYRLGSYVWLGEDSRAYLDWLEAIRHAAVLRSAG